MFKVRQHIEFDKNYNILYFKETMNEVMTFWERFHYVSNELIYSEDSNNYKYLYKNNGKVNKKPIEFVDPYIIHDGIPQINDIVNALRQNLMMEINNNILNDII